MCFLSLQEQQLHNKKKKEKSKIKDGHIACDICRWANHHFCCLVHISSLLFLSLCLFLFYFGVAAVISVEVT